MKAILTVQPSRFASGGTVFPGLFDAYLSPDGSHFNELTMGQVVDVARKHNADVRLVGEIDSGPPENPTGVEG